MIDKNTQETLMNSAMHFKVYHVFQSAVKFDMFIVTSLGVLQYDSFAYDWIKTDMKTRDALLEKYKHKPIYSHAEVVDNLMFWKNVNVQSLTNVSYTDL
ncbi:MAG: hypothetical protein RSC93_02185 [Erysipelotrichaceae bacterium]